jgi:hypothetical protein
MFSGKKVIPKKELNELRREADIQRMVCPK